MPRKKKTPVFEDALKDLENIVERMEQGELSLEESLLSFEQGINLTRTCQDALKEAEQKVNILIDKNSDTPTRPFDFPEANETEANDK